MSRLEILLITGIVCIVCATAFFYVSQNPGMLSFQESNEVKAKRVLKRYFILVDHCLNLSAKKAALSAAALAVIQDLQRYGFSPQSDEKLSKNRKEFNEIDAQHEHLCKGKDDMSRSVRMLEALVKIGDFDSAAPIADLVEKELPAGF
ncbi:hypothetical protein G3N56_07825 [Desulfovibrio sulfodismutans]|uniref:Uncharacterized protein n=1 Tax=Desulfolutivibrio sulfodismutans TaxID=63561 RepID=A0A7K3NKE3_9BACT|nr:hypothetical protein [Desulfolutivibrio sulfodismutans]NDY56650.1 hypothetical protein [Desulfolutivibrio sulfodismutans]QLA11250.1 hypothetical protein GD606_02635 [Desulfolutivibrio sulfodismutans DSM 3696]